MGHAFPHQDKNPHTALNKKNKAFTMTELLVVIIIMGIMASFIVPNYQNAVAQANEREAVVKLIAITKAMEVYNAMHGSPVSYDLNDINEINTTLGTNIDPDKNNYSCVGVPVGYYCFVNSPDGWTLHSTDLQNGVVHCDSATCPSCDWQSCPGFGSLCPGFGPPCPP